MLLQHTDSSDTNKCLHIHINNNKNTTIRCFTILQLKESFPEAGRTVRTTHKSELGNQNTSPVILTNFGYENTIDDLCFLLPFLLIRNNLMFKNSSTRTLLFPSILLFLLLHMHTTTAN